MTGVGGAESGILPASEPMIVTIDGPAGTGKSTVARELAIRLGLEFLDTGAMYRAAAAIALDRGIALDDEQGVARAALEADLHFDWSTDPPALMAFWVPIVDRLRQPDVSRAVSPVASLPAVRDVMVRRQRVIGQQHPRLVTEGRDQGSVVFPQAEVKIYLDASRGVRARRRYEQLQESGIAASMDSVEHELADRDHRDSTRAVGPLICPEDAMLVDTTDMDFGEVVDTLESIVRERVASRAGAGARA
ncbi:MAG: (d)CMP kinase [Phycisphaerales bacterium]